LECGGKKRLDIESCGDVTEITYSAPVGFNYRWYLSTNPSQTISTNRSVSVSTSITATLYCDVSFVDKPYCYFTSQPVLPKDIPMLILLLIELDVTTPLNLQITVPFQTMESFQMEVETPVKPIIGISETGKHPNKNTLYYV
jgi:hypothetical protein